jgi:tetratricopeptide (TPR) repeat protein
MTDSVFCVRASRFAVILVIAALVGGAVSAQTPPRPDGIDRGRQLLQQGSIAEAVVVLRGVVDEDPDNADAQLLLGRALALVPEPTGSLAALRRAVDLRPSSADAHYTLGTAFARFGQLDPARHAFARAVELAPAFAEAHVALALILAQAQEPGAARRHLSRAIAIQGRLPSAAYAHYLMAQILRQEQRPEQALEHLAAAVALRPGYGEAYFSTGSVRRGLLDDQGALEAFERAAGLLPDDPAAHAALGAAYLRARRTGEAIARLQHAVRLKPADRSARYDLCRALRVANRLDEARECSRALSERIQAESADADIEAAAENNRGVELEASGRLTDALDRYRAAVALNPFNTVFRRNVALAFCRLGRWGDGIAELEKVLDADPDDEAAIKALYIAKDRARAASR